MRLRLFAAVALVAIVAPPPITANGGWNDPTSDQFHIQTDEGPERSFRYQTQSGQYRKEKRLEDGTVVGSYGWIDSDGLLRLRDYIADNAGYRILRTKNVYVGKNRPISQAIKAAKKVPSSGGVLTNTNEVKSATEYLPPPVSSTPSPFVPSVDISHNSFPSSTESPIFHSTTPLPPTSTILPPPHSSSLPPSSYVPSSTAAPIFIQSSTPSTIYIPSKAFSSTPYSHSTPLYQTPTQNFLPAHSTIAPPISSNSLDYYSGEPQYEHYNKQNPYVFHNGPTYPIDRHGNTYLGYNAIGNGYEPQYPNYDGVSVTNDGFRYYIPRAYHEEQQAQDDKKTGSFGYIDPFGIRRVIYYNAGPNGFQHRKNNRYVGFSATPYDPRPY